GRFTDAEFADDGAVITGGADGGLRRWPVDGGAPRLLYLHGGELESVTAARGVVAAGARDGAVVRCASDGDCLRLDGHRGGVRAVAFAADGMLASTGNDGALRLWAAPRGKTRPFAQADPTGY